MKKFIFAIIIIIALSLFASCSLSNPKSNQETGTSKDAEDETISNIKPPNSTPSEGQFISDILKPQSNALKIKASHVKKIGKVKYGPEGQDWLLVVGNKANLHTRDKKSYIVNIATEEKKQIQRPKILEEQTVGGSGLGVVMYGRYQYSWGNYGLDDLNEPGQIQQGLKLTCLDFETAKETIVETASAVQHSFHLCKLNEDEFLTYYIDYENMNDGMNEVLISVVKKHNIKNNTITEIINEPCSWVDEKSTKGFVLEKVCVSNGQIIAFGRVTKDNKSQFYLYYFDSNGKLLKQTPCQRIEEVLTDNSMQKFYVQDDKMIFMTASLGYWYVYKITDDNVEPLLFLDGKSSSSFSFTHESLTSRDEMPYIPIEISSVGNGDDNVNKNQYFYAWECSTGKIKCFEVDIDENYPWIEGITMNWDGDIFIILMGNEDISDMNQYMIPKETWLSLLKDAPYLA